MNRIYKIVFRFKSTVKIVVSEISKIKGSMCAVGMTTAMLSSSCLAVEYLGLDDIGGFLKGKEYWTSYDGTERVDYSVIGSLNGLQN